MLLMLQTVFRPVVVAGTLTVVPVRRRVHADGEVNAADLEVADCLPERLGVRLGERARTRDGQRDRHLR